MLVHVSFPASEGHRQVAAHARDAGSAAHLPDVVQVRSLAHKGSRNEVNVVGEAPVNQIILVFGSQSWKVHHHSWQVHILPLPVIPPFQG